jgi:hypothetical protein
MSEIWFKKWIFMPPTSDSKVIKSHSLNIMLWLHLNSLTILFLGVRVQINKQVAIT